jgi:peptidoglycan/LPS O-acetylase OafA/YrhL
VSAHTAGYPFIGGSASVQIFFMISGFLVSYILVEAEEYSSTARFYVNRFLRLYPIYITVCFITIAVLFLFNRNMPFLSVFNDSPTLVKIILVVSNLSFFLADSIYFIGIDEGNLIFTTNFQESEIPLTYGLIIPPTWSLALEVTFYLIAPLIIRRRLIIFVLLISSVIIRILLIKLNLGFSDPWSYRFFPTELSLFLLGVISHQYLRPIYKNINNLILIKTLKYGVLSLTVLIIVFFPILKFSYNSKLIMLISVFFFFLPILFIFQQKNRLDRFLGELSYPVYLVHWSVKWYISYFPNFSNSLNGYSYSLLCMAISITYSVILIYVIGKPIDKIRSKLKSKKI